MGFFDFIREKLTGSNAANAAVLKVYRDSLLDNSIQPCIPVQAIQDRVKELRDELADPNVPLRLGELYRIEAELWNYFTDSTVLARFWAVRDRFSRVASAESQAKYEQTVPATNDPKWADPDFARDQARTLIDAIQSNQLINLEREKFADMLRRTVFGIGVILVAILLVIFVIAADNEKHGLLMYYGILFFLGMLGACISYIRRLQSAVDHNVLTGDGLAELYTIASNRITALSTLMVGGVFAIVLYWLVLSSAFAALVPAGADTPPPPAQDQSLPPAPAGNSTTRKATDILANNESAGTGAQNDPKAQLATKNAEALKQRTDVARINAELASVVPGTRLPDCLAKAEPDCTCDCKPLGAAAFATNSAHMLGLADARSFYLMLILAFLAGFAEQLVPDALDKLSRRLNKAS